MGKPTASATTHQKRVASGSSRGGQYAPGSRAELPESEPLSLSRSAATPSAVERPTLRFRGHSARLRFDGEEWVSPTPMGSPIMREFLTKFTGSVAEVIDFRAQVLCDLLNEKDVPTDPSSKHETSACVSAASGAVSTAGYWFIRQGEWGSSGDANRDVASSSKPVSAMTQLRTIRYVLDRKQMTASETTEFPHFNDPAERDTYRTSGCPDALMGTHALFRQDTALGEDGRLVHRYAAMPIREGGRLALEDPATCTDERITVPEVVMGRGKSGAPAVCRGWMAAYLLATTEESDPLREQAVEAITGLKKDAYEVVQTLCNVTDADITHGGSQAEGINREAVHTALARIAHLDPKECAASSLLHVLAMTKQRSLRPLLDRYGCPQHSLKELQRCLVQHQSGR